MRKSGRKRDTIAGRAGTRGKCRGNGGAKGGRDGECVYIDVQQYEEAVLLENLMGWDGEETLGA